MKSIHRTSVSLASIAFSRTHGRLAELPGILQADALRGATTGVRADLGQFFTPPEVGRLMASMFSAGGPIVRLLDPGAGAGSLSAAFVEYMLSDAEPPERIEIVAYEVDESLMDALRASLEACGATAAMAGIDLRWTARNADFISEAADIARGDLFHRGSPLFDYVIVNPPYRKLRTDSRYRRILRGLGIEVSNLYAAFVSLGLRLLRERGELVAITPRSFCNGSYFGKFRAHLLQSASLDRVHVFGSRASAFAEDDVLQENVILKVTRHVRQARLVEVTASQGREDDLIVRSVSYEQMVKPGDSELFIHIPDTNRADVASHVVAALPCSLHDTGLEVSTGRVVDFRVRPFLRQTVTQDAVPLLYPACITSGMVRWPQQRGKKPVALVVDRATRKLLVPAGNYVLVKRFTSKEERRRIVAAVLRSDELPASEYAFENHLNFFHVGGEGLDSALAVGLAVFLNSTEIDDFFRAFSGHTQVNAGDLRKLRYPTPDTLRRLGCRFDAAEKDEVAIDAIIRREIPAFNGDREVVSDREKRIAESLDALIQLGLPREQQNDRSALALLALLDLTSNKAWNESEAPLVGVTPLMDFAAREYGRHYAPNTRETFRRFTLHQFVAAGLVVPNPDEPGRPTNSPKYCYQIDERALEVLRTYGSPDWVGECARFVAETGTLRERYARARAMERIPLRIAGTEGLSLSPGSHNELIVKILDEFCPRFTPDARPVYVGDTGEKWAYFDRELLDDLGVHIEVHGKMPDVVVYLSEREWLIVVEAVTSHGPVNPKRHEELNELFSDSSAGLVFVTAFLTRRDLTKYLGDIAWETEVWVADHPTHLIHFDGVRFLGPYSQRHAEG